MFVKRNDSLDGPVQKVMRENALRREVEQTVLSEMNVVAVGQFTTENKKIYDKVLAEVNDVVLAEGFAGNIQEVSKEKLRAYSAKAGDQYFKSKKIDNSDTKSYDNAIKRHSGRMMATNKLSGRAKVNASEETLPEEVTDGVDINTRGKRSGLVAKAKKGSKVKVKYGNDADDDGVSYKITQGKRQLGHGAHFYAGSGYDSSYKEGRTKKGDYSAGEKLPVRNALAKATNKVNSKVREEVEQIDEISSYKASEYIKKASKDAGDAEYNAGARRVDDPKTSQKAGARADKRYAGIKRAVNKLGGYSATTDNVLATRRKEQKKVLPTRTDEETLSELSKEKLQNYVKKATTHLTNNAYNDDDKSSKRIQSRNVAMKKIDSKKKLNEVSKEKLGSYAWKSKNQLGNDMYTAGNDAVGSRDPRNSDYEKEAAAGREKRSWKTATKRNKGLDNALNKLSGRAKVNASEETISELSTEKLKGYINKGYGDIDKKVTSGDHKKANRRLDKMNLASAKIRGTPYARVLSKEETISELSKGTLGSYIKKASKSAVKNDSQAKAAAQDATRETSDKDRKRVLHGMADKYGMKADNRLSGIERASDKLAKEEVVSELSKEKLGRYIVASSGNMAGQEAAGNLKKADSRWAGIKKAVNKVTSKEPDKKLEARRRASLERLDELSRGGILSRYINRVGDDSTGEKVSQNRQDGRKLALKKKWGDKNYGLPEPKVKGTDTRSDGKPLRVGEETVAEVYKSTVSSYITKAVDSAHKLGKEGSKKSDEKAEKRKRGVACAVNKLKGYECKVPAGRLSDGF